MADLGFWSFAQREPDLLLFPYILPVEQGIRPRDGFALDCTHRQSNLLRVAGVGARLRRPPAQGSMGTRP